MPKRTSQFMQARRSESQGSRVRRIFSDPSPELRDNSEVGSETAARPLASHLCDARLAADGALHAHDEVGVPEGGVGGEARLEALAQAEVGIPEGR
eukprot:15467125-Alexandrium_andersonii.AAC.1